MEYIIAVSVIFSLICCSEWLWRRHRVHPEYASKFVHITVGTFVASWAFFLSRMAIATFSVAFVAVVLISNQLNVFKAIHSVQRPTWGEVCFAVAVGLLAFLSADKWIYSAALLHMGLAEGLAAIVGTKYGRHNQYKIAGHPTSVAGTATFFSASLSILAAYGVFAHVTIGPWVLVSATGATLLENFAIRGLDNLLVPVYVATVLVFIT